MMVFAQAASSASEPAGGVQTSSRRRLGESPTDAAPAGGDARLTMLGAKSTCKDRWRQVLAEAEKISRKHLLTLEPGISEPQTDQMEASSLQLVVPSPVQDSYTAAQRGWLWSVGDFIEEVRARQGQL